MPLDRYHGLDGKEDASSARHAEHHVDMRTHPNFLRGITDLYDSLTGKCLYVG